MTEISVISGEISPIIEVMKITVFIRAAELKHIRNLPLPRNCLRPRPNRVCHQPRPGAGKGLFLWAGSRWLAIGDGWGVRPPRPSLANLQPRTDYTTSRCRLFKIASAKDDDIPRFFAGVDIALPSSRLVQARPVFGSHSNDCLSKLKR